MSLQKCTSSTCSDNDTGRLWKDSSMQLEIVCSFSKSFEGLQRIAFDVLDWNLTRVEFKHNMYKQLS